MQEQTQVRPQSDNEIVGRQLQELLQKITTSMQQKGLSYNEALLAAGALYVGTSWQAKEKFALFPKFPGSGAIQVTDFYYQDAHLIHVELLLESEGGRYTLWRGNHNGNVYLLENLSSRKVLHPAMSYFDIREIEWLLHNYPSFINPFFDKYYGWLARQFGMEYGLRGEYIIYSPDTIKFLVGKFVDLVTFVTIEAEVYKWDGRWTHQSIPRDQSVQIMVEAYGGSHKKTGLISPDCVTKAYQKFKGKNVAILPSKIGRIML